MNTTEDRPQLTNEQINAMLGSNSTNEVPTILEVTDEVNNDAMADINVDINLHSENPFIARNNKKVSTLESDNTLVRYNLTESNFKGDVKVSEVESELVIEVPEGNSYIGEFMTDLPDNVMFNKVTTGSGMTTLALTNDVKYVIAVPYVTLMLNKEVWCTNNGIDALFVHAKGHREEDIYSYTGNKIMVTYDSLHKVTNILKESRNISEWKLFVDESHRLLQITNFRYKAVNTILNNFKEYDRYVFGTATPVLDKYKLTETSKIKKCRLQWPDLEEVKVGIVDITKEDATINQMATTILKDHHTGKIDGNAHVFVNSVKMIVQIFKSIKRFGIKTTDIRVVCAESDYNTKTLAKEGLAIGTVDSTLRGINFYTSTAFEGCDISDVDGRSYVVVDANREHTTIDIYTTLPQIIGRIRDTKYKNQCTLIVDPSNKFFATLEEFEEGIREQISKGRNIVKTYDNSEDNVKEWLLEKIEDSNYVIYDADTNTLKSNENAHLSEMNSFETKSNPLYIKSNTNSLLGKHVNNTITTNYIESKVVIDELLHLVPENPSRSVNTLKTLKAFCKEYTGVNTEVERLKVLEKYTQVCDFVSEAMKIGVDRMRALGYEKKRIQAEIDFTDTRTKNNRELKLLNTLKLKAGQWYSSKVLKAKIQKIYDQQGIYAKANTEHLTGIYDMKPKRMLVKKAKTSGVVITAIKLKV